MEYILAQIQADVNRECSFFYEQWPLFVLRFGFFESLYQKSCKNMELLHVGPPGAAVKYRWHDMKYMLRMCEMQLRCVKYAPSAHV